MKYGAENLKKKNYPVKYVADINIEFSDMTIGGYYIVYKLVSIIVPVYNSASYLKGCIESVLKQTYKDFELLLITDGSTDGSEELCREIASQDQRIRFLLQEHRGVSATRNVGIENAVGEYLFFLDSDDAIHPQLLEKLLKLEEKTKAVIVAEDFFSISSKQFERSVLRLSAFNKKLSGKKYRYLNQQKALRYLLFNYSQGQLFAIGGKLIRREDACTVRFDESISYGEDTKYMYQLLARGADVAVLCEEGYYYREHNESLSNTQMLVYYKDMYICSRYIWLHEKAKKREANAQKWAESFMGKIAAWHVNAHIKRNCVLIKYTLKLAKKEKKYLIPEETDKRVVLECLLAFYCYPAYQCGHMICDGWRSIRKKFYFVYRL